MRLGTLVELTDLVCTRLDREHPELGAICIAWTSCELQQIRVPEPLSDPTG
jgi:hypothetical protein